MESFRNEKREQTTSVTPILNTILAELPPFEPQLEMLCILKVTRKVQSRLLQKMKEGSITLTQVDIENELCALPNVSGIEGNKKEIIKWIQVNLPYHDIKSLPIE